MAKRIVEKKRPVLEVEATFVKDSKNYHRFMVPKSAQLLLTYESVYVADIDGVLPECIVIKLKSDLTKR